MPNNGKREGRNAEKRKPQLQPAQVPHDVQRKRKEKVGGKGRKGSNPDITQIFERG